MIIGVTGMIGSGKTTVSRMIARKIRCIHIDADTISKNVYRKKSARIRRVFGTVDREKIAEIVFKDRKKLAILNRMLHPEIISILRWESGRRRFAVLDVPLLIETEAHKFVDAVVLVTCKSGVRIRRLKKKGYTRQEIALRAMSQTPEHEKRKHADYIINNSSSKKMTKKQVDEICKRLKR